ncbi:CU044_2847 family protein [Streptomyces coeruleorubidus]|uniref:CU044_2847 family protein n=1 Tax=Streptomyces coeruleorubidus TaxID=116188 RepID=UPI00237FD05B|nr:CU044_2847 family protein [Streptomyces coeruleorubidus]WDV53123.1 CU044_2847 family protein [Streptomyces coeruleorubidus]
MTQYAELLLDDSTVIRLELSPVGGPQADGQEPDSEEYGEFEDVPDGMRGAEPVGRLRDAARVLVGGTVRGALSPLGPLLREVHATVTSVDDPPQEFSVEFGLQLGQDLKLGIVGVNSASSLKVSATWRPVPDNVVAAAPGQGTVV